jgi:Zn-dependent protease with chaperone function
MQFHHRISFVVPMLLLLSPMAGESAGMTTENPYPATEVMAVPEPSPQARQFHQGNQWIWAGSELISLAIPLLILLTPLNAYFERKAWAAGFGYRVGAIFFYVSIVMAFSFLLRLPWSFGFGHVRLKAYGLATNSGLAWLGDSLKSLCVMILIQAFIASIIWGFLLLRFPRMWWFWTAAGTMPFLVAGAFLMPLLIDPLFNRFGPMQDKKLEAEILELSSRTGVGQSRVFEVDKSRQTKSVNAYVTGMFGSKRVVLWDTLLKAMPSREVKSVVAHELGHYVLGHVRLGVMIGGISAFGGLFLLKMASSWVLIRWGDRLGIESLSSLKSIPLVVLLATAGELMAAPMSNAISRYMEHEADRFAIELTRDPAAFSRAFITLQKENLSVPFPGWLYRTWRATHPSIGQRIEFANSYRPWLEGKPGKYIP